MKRCLKLTIGITLLAILVGCGKDNKSGKSNGIHPWSVGGMNPYTAGMQTPGYGNYSVSQVIAENPCGGSPYGAQMQRMQIQIPLQNFPTMIPANDIYVGVTSYGDVGAIVGTGGQPTFVGYICPRSPATGQGQLTGIRLAPYTQCTGFKGLASATMYFPDGTNASFRLMDYGTSMGTRFSFCR